MVVSTVGDFAKVRVDEDVLLVDEGPGSRVDSDDVSFEDLSVGGFFDEGEEIQDGLRCPERMAILRVFLGVLILLRGWRSAVLCSYSFINSSA